jgi:hypothetical protein
MMRLAGALALFPFLAFAQPSVQSLLDAGGTVRLPPGRYPISEPLHISSGTTVMCGTGVVFVATPPWRRSPIILENEHHEAAQITDHDIAIEGCGFDLSEFDKGNFHAINIRMARHVRVSRVHCMNGGDCVAFQATDDTRIEDSTATGITNACWDHWEAPINGVVLSGQCSTKRDGAGLFITGGGGNKPNEIARNFRVEGGTYRIGGPGVGIWVMGLGRPGDNDGAQNVRISGVRIDLGQRGQPCFKVSGATRDVLVSDFTCTGGAGGAIYVGPGGDNGGRPGLVRFTNGSVPYHRGRGVHQPISIDADGGDARGVRLAPQD